MGLEHAILRVVTSEEKKERFVMLQEQSTRFSEVLKYYQQRYEGG